ncbi:ATP-dependent (S)-NAD(P)H-hydrate dehydratase [Phytophthora nicotianae]|uniref:ATP-dependent (S)-NAD(P)H-hydrate dehydratase n=1 Tax=Phytophthora nicotianae TaxID=4792 RepID=A0A0W8B744_PHYNI|nr:ATP-dependent (S)-NAD(P)H-hydrate dehydratase [Phytophthora nicotianae]
MSARSLVSRLIPPLAGHSHKGQQGRVGVVGGSFEYTGAPYYAGISSLKTGADLCHLFCVEEAAVPIKSYSPELIVHPLLRSDAALARCEESQRSEILAEAVERIAQVLPRLDSLVIGPGLGRDASVQEIARKVIAKAREANLPLVLDGDALYLVSVDPDTVKGYRNAILTPNAVLTGAIGTFAAWTKNADLGDFDGNPLLLAAYGGSLVTRASSSLAFDEHQRSMTAPDVLHSVGKGFIKAFPNSSM